MLLKLSRLLKRVLRRPLTLKTPLTPNQLKVMFIIRSFVIAAGSTSGRVNSLRVGLLSGSHPHSKCCLQDLHQWA
uniref:Uncharacterized protein n=1 Tax=Arundo donax TaxID=35708 RepID=A0A0A9GN62_ARUDO